MSLALVTLLAISAQAPASAQPMAIHSQFGAMRGFLTIHSEAGATIGSGEYMESARGERVTSRLILRLRDGSLDDETTMFSQRGGAMRLISDHHLQRGPFFHDPMDMHIAADGTITIRSLSSLGSDGKARQETSHIDLPADLANGLFAPLLLNTRPDATLFRVGMLAPVGKGRLIRVAIHPSATARVVCVTGQTHTATIFQLRPELGGIVGVVAPLIGKQPGDLYMWIVGGDVPVIVRVVGALAEGGPVVSVELAGTQFPPAAEENLPALHGR